MSVETAATVKLPSILSSLSYALDLIEGHPRGHASRSWLIGMRIGRALGLSAADQSDLFYALLLKDAGCLSNLARVFQLFGGDERAAKRGVWMRDWRKLRQQIAYVLDYAEPEGKLFERVQRLAKLAAKGPASRRMLFEVRCDRGAEIARTLGFSQPTAQAIRCMEEHWDAAAIPTACGATPSRCSRASSGSRRSPRFSRARKTRRARRRWGSSGAAAGSTPRSSTRS